MTGDESRNRLQALALLGSALAGRTIGVQPAAPGAPAWSDGTIVYLDESAAPRELLEQLSVQACLLSAGSLTPAVMRKLGRRETLARRYLAIEGHRALAGHEDLLPRGVRTLLDRDVAARSDSPESSLALAGPREAIAATPAAFGAIRAREVLAALRDSTAVHRPRGDRDEDLAEFDDDSEDETGALTDPFSSPVGGGGAIGKLLQRLLKGARQSGGDGQPGADSPNRRSRSGRAGTGTVTSYTPGATPDDGAGGEGEGGESTYPEWDTGRRRYRPAWCTVTEVDPPTGDGEALARPDVHALRRPLTRLGTGLDTCHRQTQGDDIDIDAAVECLVDVQAGFSGDAAVYLESRHRRRDLSVLVLLDVSGSASEPGTGGRTVHHHQVTTAHALTVALHSLGDRIALYGFRSHGRTAVQVVPVLRFGEVVGAEMDRRLGSLVPGAYSRLGAAIRHGAAVMAAEAGTARRLLVVVSDGLAYDHGYERAYGAADARHALAEARRAGTGCLALTVGAATGADDLRRVFGTAAHASIARPEDLADVVGPLFRSALRSADLRRHVS